MTRRIVNELGRPEQARCRHPQWGFVVLETANGAEQIREGCPDCGARELRSLPRSEHPARHTYPVIVPARTLAPAVDYRTYLTTEAWLERREAAKARAGWRCQLCGATEVAFHVHHNTYRRLGAELETDLCVLCSDCHSIFHDRAELVEARDRRAAA